MYENMTFENIIERCLSRVSDSVDKREGAVIYDAIAPAAAELAILYIELGTLMDRVFPDTETGEDLTKKAKERSVFRHEASFAVRKAYFENAAGAGFDLPIGTRFSGGSINFTVTERIAAGQYKMKAETAGLIGNQYFGNLIPIDHVDDLAAARIADILVHGEDEEGDASLKERYFESLNSQAFGGNVTDYKNKIKQLQGVGGVKVIPTFCGGYRPADLHPPDGTESWIAGLAGAVELLNWIKRVHKMITEGVVTVGAGTVGISLINSAWSVPSDVLIDEVQTALDPVQNQGEGVGIAPINHSVMVKGVDGVTIDVSFTLTFDTGVTWEGVKDAVRSAIQSYFDDLAQTWEDNPNLVVRVSQVETKVLNVAGIIDIWGTRVNGGTANISLDANEIPILGAVKNGDS